MSEEQLVSLLSRLKEDAGLKEKLKAAPDLSSAQSIALQAGYEVSKHDWLEYQSSYSDQLSDQDLEAIAGGKGTDPCAKSSGVACKIM